MTKFDLFELIKIVLVSTHTVGETLAKKWTSMMGYGGRSDYDGERTGGGAATDGASLVVDVDFKKGESSINAIKKQKLESQSKKHHTSKYSQLKQKMEDQQVEEQAVIKTKATQKAAEFQKNKQNKDRARQSPEIRQCGLLIWESMTWSARLIAMDMNNNDCKGLVLGAGKKCKKRTIVNVGGSEIWSKLNFSNRLKEMGKQNEKFAQEWVLNVKFQDVVKDDAVLRLGMAATAAAAAEEAAAAVTTTHSSISPDVEESLPMAVHHNNTTKNTHDAVNAEHAEHAEHAEQELIGVVAGSEFDVELQLHQNYLLESKKKLQEMQSQKYESNQRTLMVEEKRKMELELQLEAEQQKQEEIEEEEIEEEVEEQRMKLLELLLKGEKINPINPIDIGDMDISIEQLLKTDQPPSEEQAIEIGFRYYQGLTDYERFCLLELSELDAKLFFKKETKKARKTRSTTYQQRRTQRPEDQEETGVILTEWKNLTFVNRLRLMYEEQPKKCSVVLNLPLIEAVVKEAVVKFGCAKIVKRQKKLLKKQRKQNVQQLIAYQSSQQEKEEKRKEEQQAKNTANQPSQFGSAICVYQPLRAVKDYFLPKEKDNVKNVLLLRKGQQYSGISLQNGWWELEHTGDIFPDHCVAIAVPAGSGNNGVAQLIKVQNLFRSIHYGIFDWFLIGF